MADTGLASAVKSSLRVTKANKHGGVHSTLCGLGISFTQHSDYDIINV